EGACSQGHEVRRRDGGVARLGRNRGGRCHGRRGQGTCRDGQERRNDRDATKSTSHAGASPVGFIDARPCRGWGGSGSLRRGRATAPTTLGRRFLVLGGAALAVL